MPKVKILHKKTSLAYFINIFALFFLKDNRKNFLNIIQIFLESFKTIW